MPCSLRYDSLSGVPSACLLASSASTYARKSNGGIVGLHSPTDRVPAAAQHNKHTANSAT